MEKFENPDFSLSVRYKTRFYGSSIFLSMFTYLLFLYVLSKEKTPIDLSYFALNLGVIFLLLAFSGQFSTKILITNKKITILSWFSLLTNEYWFENLRIEQYGKTSFRLFINKRFVVFDKNMENYEEACHYLSYLMGSSN